MATLAHKTPVVVKIRTVDLDAVRRRLEALGKLCLRGAMHRDPREVLATMRLVEMEGQR